MTWVTDLKKRTEYYEKTSLDKPSNLLVEALKFVTITKTALDLGCGAGVEAKKLAEFGFKTIAVDINPDVKKYFHEEKTIIQVIIQPFEDFDFMHYDFIFAKNSLVFLSPRKFELVINKIKLALNQNGIFAARLWGTIDSENKTGRNYKHTFVTIDQLHHLFDGYEFLILKEMEADGLSVYGQLKHWHFIDLVVRK